MALIVRGNTSGWADLLFCELWPQKTLLNCVIYNFMILWSLSSCQDDDINTYGDYKCYIYLI